jgi:hypothetical protein
MEFLESKPLHRKYGAPVIRYGPGREKSGWGTQWKQARQRDFETVQLASGEADFPSRKMRY